MYKKFFTLALPAALLFSLGFFTEREILRATANEDQFIYDGSKHDLSSEYGDLGEKMDFLKETPEGLIFKGEYVSGVRFYRMFEVQEEQTTLIYEVTSLQKEQFKTFTKEFKPAEEQERFVVLKKPYKKGNSWDGHTITNVYSKDNKKYIEVTYSNGNVYVFEEGKGISEIHYTLPVEIMETYGGTLTSIAAKEVSDGK